MEFVSSNQALFLIQAHPKPVAEKLMALRGLIVWVAEQCDAVTRLTESVKWGQPSYASNCGSPIRVDWNSKSPETVQLYVPCQTKLVATFKTLYGEVLKLNGSRELILKIGEPFPEVILGHCIELALKYKKLKDLPLLGCDQNAE